MRSLVSLYTVASLQLAWLLSCVMFDALGILCNTCYHSVNLTVTIELNDSWWNICNRLLIKAKLVTFRGREICWDDTWWWWIMKIKWIGQYTIEQSIENNEQKQQQMIKWNKNKCTTISSLGRIGWDPPTACIRIRILKRTTLYDWHPTDTTPHTIHEMTLNGFSFSCFRKAWPQPYNWTIVLRHMKIATASFSVWRQIQEIQIFLVSSFVLPKNHWNTRKPETDESKNALAFCVISQNIILKLSYVTCFFGEKKPTYTTNLHKRTKEK